MAIPSRPCFHSATRFPTFSQMADHASPKAKSAPADGAIIFTYGTLKRGFPNHNLMKDLISSDDAAFIASGVTRQPHPLVIGPNGIPYLINIPGQGRRVKGELYRVSSRGMVRVDELEGTRVGHYERLPIRVEIDGDGEGADQPAEAYFADRAFGEKMWEKIGEGLSEYSERDGEKYVRKENRPPGSSFLGEIQLFLQPPS